MSQPASELLSEIMKINGEKRAIVGVDKRGRVDIFVYVQQHDKVYQVKLESICPGLKGNYEGYHLSGVGDELCASDEVIENIMNCGWVVEKPERFVERVEKIYSRFGGLSAILDAEGDYELFSSLPPDYDVYKQLKLKLPKNIDGRLSSDLDLHLSKQKLGSSTYIA